jgi:hypothetical protein
MKAAAETESVDPGEAVLWQQHTEFARGSAMLEMTSLNSANFTGLASGLTWHQRRDRINSGGPPSRQVRCDLVAAGRPTGPNGQPPDLLERLLHHRRA